MLEIRDPAIKLFGQTIPLLADLEIPVISGDKSSVKSKQGFNGITSQTTLESTAAAQQKGDEPEQDEKEEEEGNEEMEAEKEKPTETKHEDNPSTPAAKDEFTVENTTSETNESLTPHIKKDESSPAAASETEKDIKDSSDEAKNTQEKTIKKPDKILPCPRCNSMDTKFCYYNNYNVNQPRHFCKSCQRYWTAGGTMRNVPVGAGRRKNKNSAMRYCHVTVSEALQAARIDGTNGIHVHHPGLNTNATVLTFGSDSQNLSVSMASVPSLASDHQKMINCISDGVHKVNHVSPVHVATPCKNAGKSDDCSSGSTVAPTNIMEGSVKKVSEEPTAQNLNGLSNQLPCFPGTHWPYAWNGAVPLPAFYPSGYPMSFHPAHYWNGAIPCNIPWLPATPCTPTQDSPSLNPNSLLGKHSRDGETLNTNNGQKNSKTSVLVPKTLRIDDPEEAAKSSIWTTLGIKKEKIDPNTAGGFFKGLQSKSNDKNHKVETSSPLSANPAALARSISFGENA